MLPKAEFCHCTELSFLQFDMLELDRFAKPLVTCPMLLHPATYAPDTVDLTQDHDAREYWLQCFTDAIDKVHICIHVYLKYMYIKFTA